MRALGKYTSNTQSFHSKTDITEAETVDEAVAHRRRLR